MLTRRVALLAALAVVLAALAAGAPPALAQSSPAPAQLEIQLDKKVADVSPTLYGLMTEEINHSYDGGLYTEMVRNRAMMDGSGSIDQWQLVQQGNSSASISLDKSTGPSAALPLSLKLVATQADAADQAGVLNEGYWGMALRPDTAYRGSFFVKADSASIGPVYVSLVNDNSGQVVARATVDGLTTDWARHEFTLRTGAIEPSEENHLLLTVAHPGTVWFELVSLFPPTYHDRANGNRIDIMEKLAAMKPSFLRFPGGNYLEGDLVSQRYEWKTTIGPLVDRPTHPSPWGYQSTDGLGLLEYLEWCEDLRMQPVLAVYAGYSMRQDRIRPGPDLDPFVQNALDEIEYVTGAAGTKWGAERVRDGHPDPFALTYIEIGNEDFFDRSGSYGARYAQFYRAIKQKYPQLQIIATAPVKTVRPDVIDDHFYRSAVQFFDDTHHYDSTDRGGPKIFVGEWATREGSPTPDFGAALGDAAWMTGLERNSDIVVMASYAPLFVNVNPGAMEWSTDLIGYDALRSYGSPSYYAQVMFGNYLGSEIPASQLTGANPRVFYSVTRDAAKGVVYLKLVNASSEEQPLEIKLAGATAPEAAATVITLSAATTQATNTLADPRRIVPVNSSIHDVSPDFHYALRPYSIQVLELRVRP